MTYFCHISQHSDRSELTCHNSLHWTVTKRGHSSQFTVWTPATIPPHSESNSTIQHKATFCDQLKHNTKKNAQKSVAATYSIIMINESNKHKTQRRLQRTAVSVITHSTHAFALLKNFNATYVMHKIQRTHATQGTTSHNPDTGRSQMRQRSVWKADKRDTAHTQQHKKRKHTRRSF